MELSLRHSQFGLPVVLSTYEGFGNRETESSSLGRSTPESDTPLLLSPAATTFDVPGAPTEYQHSETASDFSSYTTEIQRTRSAISDFSTYTDTAGPTTLYHSLNRSPRSSSWLNPISPEETSHCPSSRSPICPDFSEKEAVGFVQDSIFASAENTQAPSLSTYNATDRYTTPSSMDWMRRRSQRTPARPASVSTFEEKRTVEQTVGVVSDDGKQILADHERSLFAQISQARAARVNAVVDLYIEPLLHEQASNGLAQSTFVLIPETWTATETADDVMGNKIYELQADFGTVLPRSQSLEMLVGFPAELNVQVVRLSPLHSGHTGHSGRAREALGDEGNRFWQQPAVRQELDRLIKIRLVSMGLDVMDPAGFTAPFRRDGWIERGEHAGAPSMMDGPSAATSGKWRGDTFEAGLGIWQNTSTKRSQGSWQTVDEGNHLLPGQARVKVSLEDVCFRIQSAMGLYDTKTDKAIIVRINIEA